MAEAIAAGEVVERPASVVKELLENSLDAGASRIAVEVRGGGSELIRVVDDGSGMAPEELALAFARHATSKLSRLDELGSLASFGFRGEALASIAAVADVLAVSRVRGAQSGARVEASASQVSEPAPVAASLGTAVEVARLFARTPARREFLRSQRSEAGACLRVVAEAALGSPEVAFEFWSEGRRQLSCPGRGGLLGAVLAVWPSVDPELLLGVEEEEESDQVLGVLGAPELARSDRQGQVVMVNGRRVHQRALVAAVEGAFRGLLPGGRFPLAVLDLQIPGGDVDVNVHPTKREVRLRREGQAFELLQRACWGALQRARPRRIGLSPADAWTGSPVSPSSPQPALAEALPSLTREGSPPPGSESLREAANWRYLGQAHRRYLLVETGTGIALLDQHAAHEKVIYARVLSHLRATESGAAATQGLLDPVLVELGPGEMEELAPMLELLTRAGFELIPFGERTLRCSAVPVGTRLEELPRMISELLGSGADGDGAEEQRLHRAAASIACHSAVRFGDHLDPREVAGLLQDLALTPGGITCPHGRPAVVQLSQASLLRSFGRR